MFAYSLLPPAGGFSMTQGHAQEENTNQYVIDAENATEMARLLEQDKQMTECMGGIFSERRPDHRADLRPSAIRDVHSESG